jgi:hypothetical protein
VGVASSDLFNPRTEHNGSTLNDAGVITPSGVDRGDAYDGAFAFYVSSTDSVYTKTY